METPYRAVGFSKHDVIKKSDMDQIEQNLQWIFENTPRGTIYNGRGNPMAVRPVWIAGRARIKRRKHGDRAKVKVKLHGLSPNCRPHITTGIVSPSQVAIFCTVNGPKKALYPTANGFDINVEIGASSKKGDRIKKTFYVHWQAFGYRELNLNEF